ncbi:MAG: hypothetical protein ISN29_07865 [Gammaproteobacteria bacterium AqS3]|nr:hypothetical protein [Gammaproteobacteria bacterium AqS3]
MAANIRDGSYSFLKNLLALEASSSQSMAWENPVGFLPESEWDPFLVAMPDQEFSAFLRRGIQSGFRIGVPPSARLSSCKSNSKSALALASKVDDYIEEEVKAGKLVISDEANVQLSSIGFIPKRNRPGKFRMIVDLSSPSGRSVNDAINPAFSSFKYVTVRQVAELLPQGSFLAKLDLKAAYRKVPVHVADQKFLGVSWRGKTYCDKALPFGLRSAPIIFNAVADGLAWAMICTGIMDLAHYLDDFIFWASDQQSCQRCLDTGIHTAYSLGLPVEPIKVEGPLTTLTFLGIEIDTIRRELRLPRGKLNRLKDTLRKWSTKKSATKHDLQVIIGLLNDAAQVVPAGRPFVRRLIDAMSRLRKANHVTRLEEGCRADILWWCSYIESWNGVSIFPNPIVGPSIFSDASGSWGAGAFISLDHAWFQLKWPKLWSSNNIAAKELVPIVMAIALWGHRCAHSRISLYSDNLAVVQCLESGSAKDRILSHLLRCLFFFLARHQISYRAFHIAGRNNRAADALSRDDLHVYFSIFPQAPRTPTGFPQALTSLLLDSTLSWTSKSWKELFRGCLQEV